MDFINELNSLKRIHNEKYHVLQENINKKSLDDRTIIYSCRYLP